MRQCVVALTVALLHWFHPSPISASPMSPRTMSFDSGTMSYWTGEIPDFPTVVHEPYEGGGFYSDPWTAGKQVFGYEENGMYLDIDSTYEVYFSSYIGPGSWGKFYPTPPFNSVTFSLTSGGRFNLDTIFLVIASTVSRWDIGCADVRECQGAPEYRLISSNGAEFLFPTSYDYQNQLLQFGKPFRGITSFTMLARTGLDDPVFGINSISITPVPAPGALALLGLGLIGMGYARRRNAQSLASRGTINTNLDHLVRGGFCSQVI